MKLLIRTVLFHITCILIFAFVYYYFREDFKPPIKEDFTILDYIFFSLKNNASTTTNEITPNTAVCLIKTATDKHIIETKFNSFK